MSEIRKTDPSTGGMKGEKLEQYSLVDLGMRDWLVERMIDSNRKDAAHAMLDFEGGDDMAIHDVVICSQLYLEEVVAELHGGKPGGPYSAFLAVRELARQYGFGSRKYDRGNWRKGYAWSLSVDAFWRHLFSGRDVDPESGNLHAAAVLWHACCLRDFVMIGLGTDDRLYKDPVYAEPKPVQPTTQMGAMLEAIHQEKERSDRELVSVLGIPLLASDFAPKDRIFIVDSAGTCTPTPIIADLEAERCDGCEERERCEAEAGL